MMLYNNELMLRQYGVATPSSLVPVNQPEDAQPNEKINKRSQKQPPSIRSTAPVPTRTHNHFNSRGSRGYRGGLMSQRGTFVQYGIRGGGSSYRGRGKHSDRSGGYSGSSSSSRAAREQDSRYPMGSPSSMIQSQNQVQHGNFEPSGSSQSTRTVSNSLQSHSSLTNDDHDHDNTSTLNSKRKSTTPDSHPYNTYAPTTPSKRRRTDQEHEHTTPTSSYSAAMPPPSSVSRLPLPGRLGLSPVKKQLSVMDIKQENDSPSNSLTFESSVKRESFSPSPTSSAVPERKLVTESCSFFPLPENCQKSDPQCRENRRAFFQTNYKELLSYGLKKTKAFYRDDGLVIEWKSHIPVWSDTLRPKASDMAAVIQQAHKINAELNASVSPNRRKRQSSVRSNTSSLSTSTEGRSKRGRQETPKDAVTPNLEFFPRTISPSPTPESFLPRKVTRPPLSRPLPLKPRSPPAPELLLPQKVTQLPPSLPLKPSPESFLPKKIKRPQLPRLLPSKPGSAVVPVAFSPRSSRSGMSNSLSKSQSHEIEGHINLEEGMQRDSASPEVSSDTKSVPTRIWSKGVDSYVTISGDASGSNKNKQVESTTSTEGEEDADEVADALLTPTQEEDQRRLRGARVLEDDEDMEIEVLAAEFLQRYCRVFDVDRTMLEMAYDQNALFSCRVHHLKEPSFSMAGLFAPEIKPLFRSSHSRASASAVHQGRTQIGDRLLRLGPYQFCPRGQTRSLHYDVVESARVGLILLTVHGEVVNPHVGGPQLDHILTLDQSFVLRRRKRDDEDDDDGLGHRVRNNWPLIAVCHQMTVRAGPLLDVGQLGDLLPWTKELLL